MRLLMLLMVSTIVLTSCFKKPKVYHKEEEQVVVDTIKTDTVVETVKTRVISNWFTLNYVEDKKGVHNSPKAFTFEGNSMYIADTANMIKTPYNRIKMTLQKSEGLTKQFAAQLPSVVTDDIKFDRVSITIDTASNLSSIKFKNLGVKFMKESTPTIVKVPSSKKSSNSCQCWQCYRPFNDCYREAKKKGLSEFDWWDGKKLTKIAVK